MKRLLAVLALLTGPAWGASITAAGSPNAIARIVGGTIDGAVIGGTTPAAVTATTLTANTALRMPNGANAEYGEWAWVSNVWTGRTVTNGGTARSLALDSASNAVFDIFNVGGTQRGFAAAAGLGVAANHSFVLASNAMIRTAPTIASGFGTSPAISASNGSAAYALTVGSSTTGISTGTITMPAAATGWSCHIVNVTTATSRPRQSGGTTTTVVVTNYANDGSVADFTAADSLRFSCMGY